MDVKGKGDEQGDIAVDVEDEGQSADIAVDVDGEGWAGGPCS